MQNFKENRNLDQYLGINKEIKENNTMIEKNIKAIKNLDLYHGKNNNNKKGENLGLFHGTKKKSKHKIGEHGKKYLDPNHKVDPFPGIKKITKTKNAKKLIHGKEDQYLGRKNKISNKATEIRLIINKDQYLDLIITEIEEGRYHGENNKNNKGKKIT